MSFEKWMSILNWQKLPHLGPIHQLPFDEMRAHYYMAPLIKEVISSLRFSLRSRASTGDKLLVGLPGSGKTTFIYYVTRGCPFDDEKLQSDYHFEVLHFNRIITDETQAAAAIAERCMEIYKRYFAVCGLDKEFAILERNSDLDNRRRINKILDLLVKAKELFAKKLVLIIDDIDEADRKVVEPMLRLLYSFIEPVSIQKWLAIRTTTLGHYPQSAVEFITTKWPERITFPRVDLHGIIAKRIVGANPEGKNPFSETISSLIIQAYNYDLRQAMGCIGKFFEINKPGALPDSTSDDYIEKYFLVALTKTLTMLQVFPNIFLTCRSSQYPLEKDVFLLLSVKHTVDNQFIRIHEKYYTATLVALRQAEAEYVEGKVVLSRKEIDGVVDFLKNHGLVEMLTYGCYAPTPRGRVFWRLLQEEYYVDMCRKEVVSTGAIRSNYYWELASINGDFANHIY